LTVKYLDPYKDDPYGKLKGDKADTWFKINFDEAKLYPTDNGYILAGFFTGYAGIFRNFKASEPLAPGLCALPIYSQEYELWEKGDDGKSKPVKYQPSKFEKALSAYIESTKSDWMPEGKNIGGEISFSPDAQVQNFRETDLPQFVTSSCKVDEAVERMRTYWDWFRQETETSGGLGVLLKQLIAQEEKNAKLGTRPIELYSPQIKGQIDM
jgi:hypothetical protein